MSSIKLELVDSGVHSIGKDMLSPLARAAVKSLQSGQMGDTGWVDLPINYDRDEFKDICETAGKIRSDSELVVVIGIGGSYMGARSVYEALGGKKDIELEFAGHSLSASYHKRILDKMDQAKDVSIIMISKSGNTMEPLIAFSIFKEAMKKRYGDKANERIYVITDREKGRLKEEANREGYKSFVVPDDIGGRFSVFTPVGLLPLAVAGVDIQAFIDGAADIAGDIKWLSKLSEYAICRQSQPKMGKYIEVFAYFRPELHYFGEWLKQLFGESEGKERKGIFPTSLMYTRDLHSMEQFIQDGRQIFFETMIIAEEHEIDLEIPESAGEMLGGMTMEQVNDCAFRGTYKAHRGGEVMVPGMKIIIPRLDEFHLGTLMYFFMMNCSISAAISGVHPFGQPAVEDYKKAIDFELKMLKP